MFIGEIARLLGETDEQVIDRISNDVIANGSLRELQQQTTTIEGYLDMIHYVASLTGRGAEGMRVAEYIQGTVNEVRARASHGEKPRVLTVVSHPLYPMYASKVPNLLVDLAGGRSLNRELGFKESTDAEYTVEEFNRLDPDVILIAGHSTDPVPEFYRTCNELGISCRALSTGRVHGLSIACGPRPPDLVLSLMDIANFIQPGIFYYSLAAEAAKMDREMNRCPGG